MISGDCPDLDTKDKRLVMNHVGLEDSVMNHLILIKDIEEMTLAGITQKEIRHQIEKVTLSHRHFTV